MIVFDGNFLPSLFVDSHPDNSIGSFAKFSEYFIFLESLLSFDFGIDVEEFRFRIFLFFIVFFVFHFEFVDVVGDLCLLHHFCQ